MADRKIVQEEARKCQIAFCDDKEKELDKLGHMIQTYQKQRGGNVFFIRRFSSAEELLREVRENGYAPELIFLDIFMPGKLGTDAARELRDTGIGCQIIFLTVSREYALEAFQVDAVQYLVKPVSEEELFAALDKAWIKIDEDSRRYLLLPIKNRLCRIPLRDIVYVEAQKKCQCVYLANGEQYVLRLTMAKIYESLSGYGEFVRAGVSYIVNLQHIESLCAQSIHIDNGTKIYLPRGAYPVLKKQYFGYYTNRPDDGQAGYI